MIDQRYVDYIRENMSKFPIESIKQALAKAGVGPADVEEAVRVASGRPAASAAAEVPAQASAPARGIVSSALGVLFQPTEFFRTMPKTGPWREPILFILAMLSAPIILGNVFIVLLGRVIPIPLPWTQMWQGLAGTIMGFVLYGIVIGSIIFLIASVIAHAIWMALGSKECFQTTVRCLVFMLALVPAQAVLGTVGMLGVALAVRSGKLPMLAAPFASSFMAIPVLFYGIYLLIPASTEVHGIKKGRAAAAAAVFGVLCLFMLVSPVMAVWKLRRVSSAFKTPVSMGVDPAPMAVLGQAMAQMQNNRPQFPPLGGSSGMGQPAAVDPAAAMRALQALGARPNGGAAVADPAAAMRALQALGAQPNAGAVDPAAAMRALQALGVQPNAGMVDPAQAVSGAMQALGATPGVKPVDPQILRDMLPENLLGMPRAKFESGRQGPGPLQMSTARAVYQSQDGRELTVSIFDTAGFGAMAGAFGALAQEDQFRVRRPVQYKGFKAVEDFYKDGRRAELQVLAAQRFAVRVAGRGVDIGTVRKAMDDLDLESLARRAR